MIKGFLFLLLLLLICYDFKFLVIETLLFLLFSLKFSNIWGHQEVKEPCRSGFWVSWRTAAALGERGDGLGIPAWL